MNEDRDHLPDAFPPQEEYPADAFTALPPAPAPHHSVPLEEPAEGPAVAREAKPPGTLWTHVVPAMVFLGMVVVILYAAPFLVSHWQVMGARTEAETHYQRRRAELKAEAEHADERLEQLDKRVRLTSLGFREVVRKVTPQVVNILNLREPRDAEKGIARKTLFFDPETNRRYAQNGVGSGLIVRKGVILTNHHVVKGAQRLRITFASGQSFGLDPEKVRADPITDLAVLLLPELPARFREDLEQTVQFADSDKDVEVGDWALAVGSPLGLKQTVTQGVISAKGRLLHLLDMVELLQTDAAINPGNSGGPLFDQHGRVAGINVAIASDNGGNQGIGFAIPSNTIRKIMDQLVEEGEVPRGFLGISMEEATGPELKKLGLEDQGAIQIVDVLPGHAAEKAGLQRGDYITRVGKEPLRPFQPVRHFRQLIVDVPPDTEIQLAVVRSGQERTLAVRIGRRPTDIR